MSKGSVWNSNYFFVLCTIVLCGAFTMYAGKKPEIYGFSNDLTHSNFIKILDSPIHLADDVMISLRTGYILNEIGFPAFNRIDIAQPSTSYLSPYLFALLLKGFPENTAVLLYATLGFLSVIFTFGAIAFIAKSKVNAALIVGALCFTTTNLGYALNGWDHLFQAFFFTLATVIVLRDRSEWWVHMSIFVCLTLGVLFRPDGMILAITILISIFHYDNKKKIICFSILPFVFTVGCALLINFEQFGHLTPTTARLKLGSSPSIEYSLRYILNNGLLSFSAITLLLIFFCFYVKYRKKYSRSVDLPIVLGCFITSLFLFFNSDVFLGGRMFWTPTCVMATLHVFRFSSLSKNDNSSFKESIEVSNGYRSKLLNTLYSPCLRYLIFFIIGVIFIVNFSLSMKGLIKKSVINYSNIYTSPTAQQFIIAKWIERNLYPKDGPIGFFWLGVSYHLPSFEIADFLGKADELIAMSKIKWGPPGHNKWDIDKTLSKWDLQVIVPSGNSDGSRIGVVENAKLAIKERRDFGFSPDLLLNSRVNERFTYCYIKDIENRGIVDQWGFFVRKDIALKHENGLRCM